MIRDARNQDIRPGDTVVYPGHRGTYLNEARVVSVHEAGVDSMNAFIKVTLTGGRRVSKVIRLDRVAVVARRGSLHDLTAGERDAVRSMLKGRGKIEAIKLTRSLVDGVGLLDAKNFVEAL